MSNTTSTAATSTVAGKQVYMYEHLHNVRKCYFPAASWVRKLGARSGNFPTDNYKFPTAKFVLKVSRTFTLNSTLRV